MADSNSDPSQPLLRAAKQLRREVDRIDFSAAAAWVYNPLDYAWAAHRQYLTRYTPARCKVLFLGMNPGPWGMAQTGVPFGEIPIVNDWLGIDAEIKKPDPEHPKRPIEGLQCTRSEVSGRRLWGLFKERFETPGNFFREHFVANYCPLVFMEPSARNLTPDKLPAELRRPLEAACDQHLLDTLAALRPQWLIGVGAFAEACGKRVLADEQLVKKLRGGPEIQLGRMLHPSPASPAANRDWAGTATRQLLELGVW